MVSRRDLFTGAAAMVGAGVVSRVGAASLPEAVIMQSAATHLAYGSLHNWISAASEMFRCALHDVLK